MHHPTDRIVHTTAFVTPVVEHWLEREIAQWIHPMKDRSDDPSHHERTLFTRSYISLLFHGYAQNKYILNDIRIIFRLCFSLQYFMLKWKNKNYLLLFGVGHTMEKDHSNSEKEIPLPPLHVVLFSISKYYYYLKKPKNYINPNIFSVGTDDVVMWLVRCRHVTHTSLLSNSNLPLLLFWFMALCRT